MRRHTIATSGAVAATAGGAIGRARVAFRAGCGRLRQLAIGILLLAISALVLQTPAHAGPAIHQQQAAVTASHCVQHQMTDDHGADPGAGRVNTDGSSNLTECCQTCPTATVPVAPPEFGPSVKGATFAVARPDPHQRSPEGILRPPRLIAA